MMPRCASIAKSQRRSQFVPDGCLGTMDADGCGKLPSIEGGNMKGVYTPTQARVIKPVRAKLGSLLYWEDQYALRFKLTADGHDNGIPMMLVFNGQKALLKELEDEHCVELDEDPTFLVEVLSDPQTPHALNERNSGWLALTDAGFAITFPYPQSALRGNHSGLLLADSEELSRLHIYNCHAKVVEHWRLLYRMPNKEFAVVFDRSPEAESSTPSS